MRSRTHQSKSMLLPLCFFLFAALIGRLIDEAEALHMPALVKNEIPYSSAASRRSFFATLATAGVAVTGVALPGTAWAAPAKSKDNARCKGQNECASKMIQETWDGRELNEKEEGAAGGLLSKMGLNDIEPYKDNAKARTSPAATTSRAAPSR
jgi:hypothetical protein